MGGLLNVFISLIVSVGRFLLFLIMSGMFLNVGSILRELMVVESILSLEVRSWNFKGTVVEPSKVLYLIDNFDTVNLRSIVVMCTVSCYKQL